MMDIIEIDKTTINRWISHNIEVIVTIPLLDAYNFSVVFRLAEHDVSFDCNVADFTKLINALKDMTQINILLPKDNEKCVTYLSKNNSFKIYFKCGWLILNMCETQQLLDLASEVHGILR